MWVLAEIGNYRDFSTPDKLAAWCGLVPSVHQSADKLQEALRSKVQSTFNGYWFRSLKPQPRRKDLS